MESTLSLKKDDSSSIPKKVIDSTNINSLVANAGDAGSTAPACGQYDVCTNSTHIKKKIANSSHLHTIPRAYQFMALWIKLISKTSGNNSVTIIINSNTTPVANTETKHPDHTITQ